ncbi:DUF6232 family protein [Actinoplanes sp. GCM10030250]|uniref:DUF6232 family protein n=1 Tax=Actinoplanes sp. GCM10030250 TaxID=3273376 RepID=UPI003610FDF7
MLEFYRGPRARITTDVFEMRGVHSRRFAVGQLTSVRVVRNERRASADRPVIGISALVAGLMVVPVVGPMSHLLTALILAVLALQAAYFLWPRRVRWQLVAVYQGRVEVVFASSDRQEFDQMCRGLARCLDYRQLLG